MAQLPDLETLGKEAGERGAQYALKYLEEEYGVSIRRLIELAQADKVGHCIVFDLHYPMVSEYYKDEDGLFIREASGVISKEEYEAALRREQDGNNK